MFLFEETPLARLCAQYRRGRRLVPLRSLSRTPGALHRRPRRVVDGRPCKTHGPPRSVTFEDRVPSVTRTLRWQRFRASLVKFWDDLAAVSVPARAQIPG